MNAQRLRENIFFCGYAEEDKGINICNYLNKNSFLSNEHAENAIDKILNTIGLPRNFILVSCPTIKNVVAITSKGGIRYIVYDKNFMELVDGATSNWSSVSILAHELGHHLCGHTLTGSISFADQRKKEAEADEFSGFILFKLGATLKQAQAAILMLTSDADDTNSTHPKKSKRLISIENGYNRSKGQKPINYSIDYAPSPENYFNEGLILFRLRRFPEAIVKFTTAIQKRSNFDIAYTYRAITKWASNDNNNAVEDFNNALKIDPQSIGAYVGRGLAKNNLNDYPGALADYNQAISIDPNLAFIYANRGDLKMKFNKYNEAILDYNLAVQKGIPDLDLTWLVYYHRGQSKGKTQDYRGAIIDLSYAIQIDQTQADVYSSRGLIKLISGDKAGGCSDLLKACNLGDSKMCELINNTCK